VDIYKAEHRECTTLSGLALASFCHAIGCLQMKLPAYALQPMSAPHFSAVAMHVSVHDSHDGRKGPSTVFSRRSTDQAGGNEAGVQPDYRRRDVRFWTGRGLRRTWMRAYGQQALVSLQSYLLRQHQIEVDDINDVEMGGRQPNGPR